MICPHCGNTHAEGATFCPVTGQSLLATQLCPHCGESHPAMAEFCPATGRRLSVQTETVGLRRKNQLWIGVAVGFFVIAVSIVGVWLILDTSVLDQFPPFADLNGDTTISTPTRKVARSQSPEPSAIAFTPLPTSLSTTDSLTPIAENTDNKSTTTPTIAAQDGAELIFIPEGDFVMGSDPEDDPYFWGAEAPSHIVHLSSYYIYKTEVTNARYRTCVAQQACPQPELLSSRTRQSYYDNNEFDNYPVIYVSWQNAASYCKWAGGRLPTEAEWEKAARGSEGILFPWGDEPPTGELTNLCDSTCPNSEKEYSLSDGYPDTAPVGSYPSGASPYNVMDMAGNVWEWVSDYFRPGYSLSSPMENPLGPATGDRRVIRGGSWFNPSDGVRAVARASLKPNTTLDSVGFRCVVDVP